MTRSATIAMTFLALLGLATLLPLTSAQAVNWAANGATACARYLTPAVTGAILTAPAGEARRNDVDACNIGPIYLTLKPGNVAVFRQELPMIAGAHTISGIGDIAYWNQAGALAAVKGDRECDISIFIPGAAKFTGAALAQKLGAICNQLFALP